MHTEMLERMDLALDHALGRKDARELEQHLLDCASCAREWQALSSIHQKLVNAPRMAPPPDFATRVLVRAAQQEKERARRQKWLGVSALVIGSALAAGLALVLSPLNALTETGTWVMLFGSLVRLIALSSTLLTFVQPFGQALLQITGSWPFALLALITLALALLWTRIVAGSPLNRLIHSTEV